MAQTSPKFRNSGLKSLIEIVNSSDILAHVIEFGPEDILRSEQCKQWILAFEQWERRNNG